jgi:hypothetical protein
MLAEEVLLALGVALPPHPFNRLKTATSIIAAIFFKYAPKRGDFTP